MGLFTGYPAAESIPGGTTHGPAGTWVSPAHRHPCVIQGSKVTCRAISWWQLLHSVPLGDPPFPSAQDVTRCRDILPHCVPAHARDETKGGNAGDKDGYPQASSAVFRTAPISTVWGCPLPPGTTSSGTPRAADLPLLSWQFLLRKGSHPSARASPPLAWQLPPASASPACPHHPPRQDTRPLVCWEHRHRAAPGVPSLPAVYFPFAKSL